MQFLYPTDPIDQRILALGGLAYLPEEERVGQCVGAIGEWLEAHYDAIFHQAKEYIERVRQEKVGEFEAFVQAFSLESSEGLAIMALAEALLRIPDDATADALIYDKLHDLEWIKHQHLSQPLTVNLAALGLHLSEAVVSLSENQHRGLSAKLGGVVAKLGEPVVRHSLKQAMHHLGSHFVAGESIEDAVRKGKDDYHKGYRFSYDMLGEGARTSAQAESYLEGYIEAVDALGKKVKKNSTLQERSGISVKLSALHPHYELANYAEVRGTLLPRLWAIVARAQEVGIPVTIDAEESRRLELSLLLFKELFQDPAFKDYEGLGLAVQAYQKRAGAVLEVLAELAASVGKKIPVRLVKGAYWDAEIKQAQMLGVEGYPVFTHKAHTDLSYLACAHQLAAKPECFYPQFATHNALTIASIIRLCGDHTPFEFQRLHGMGHGIYDQIIGFFPCRVYAPVGSHKELLAYLIRRLLENGANSSFIKSLTDHEVPIYTLLKNPLAQVKKQYGYEPALPLPFELFGLQRDNSQGMDMGNPHHLRQLWEGVQGYKDTYWQAAPVIGGEVVEGRVEASFQPDYTVCKVGDVTEASRRHVDKALKIAEAAHAAWDATPVEQRAAILESVASLLEERKVEAIALAIREAGKTVADAVGEVREAVDFFRYYAMQARELSIPQTLPGPTGELNQLSWHGRGVFVCISPWNFPLAIFVGQIAAALVTGNTVIAKPAEQTPLMAAFAVRLMHEAGVPKDVLQLLPGKGEVMGAALVGDARVAGVAFTGSNTTAQQIQLTLAKRGGAIAPLIAETGGLNVMIVDSSALPEAVVDDVITSAFNSAGQRCSALRVLYVQEDIADTIIALLKGALLELHIGTPADFATDIGPVIDANARSELLAHIARMKEEAIFHAAAALPKELHERGYFVAPHIFEIKQLKQLEKEVFGPILHIIRYSAGRLEQVVSDINSSGYGLTLGVHSRLQSRIDTIRRHARVGNLYVNRNMIGAVVGVQPFGGEGLSGTGFKAGGPHYLLRFMTERVFTQNMTALGGNVGLLINNN